MYKNFITIRSRRLNPIKFGKGRWGQASRPLRGFLGIQGALYVEDEPADEILSHVGMHFSTWLSFFDNWLLFSLA